MGRKGKRRNNGPSRDNWDKNVAKKEFVINPKWFAYYKAQKIAEGDDFEAMAASFLTPLPVWLLEPVIAQPNPNTTPIGPGESAHQLRLPLRRPA